MELSNSFSRIVGKILATIAIIDRGDSYACSHNTGLSFVRIIISDKIRLFSKIVSKIMVAEETEKMTEFVTESITNNIRPERFLKRAGFTCRHLNDAFLSNRNSNNPPELPWSCI